MKPTGMLKYREWKKAKYLKLKDTKVSQSNRNTRTRCKLFSKLTIKIPERRSGVFIVNFEHISHILVFLLLTLNTQFPVGIILAFNKTIIKLNLIDYLSNLTNKPLLWTLYINDILLHFIWIKKGATICLVYFAEENFVFLPGLFYCINSKRSACLILVLQLVLHSVSTLKT